MPKSQPQESTRISRWIDLDGYEITPKPGEFLEVTEWSNGEGFDLHISRGEQVISLTWGEFGALRAALGDWIYDDDTDDGESTCPHIVTSDEGTSYCKLAEQTAALLAKLRA